MNTCLVDIHGANKSNKLKWTKSPGTTSACFSVVTVNDEYRKPEFKIKRKVKEGPGLKANGIFVILLSLDVFESDSPERTSQLLPRVSSETGVGRCSSK